MKRAVVIGSINMDYVIDVQKMPVVGETLLCDNFEMIPGGKGANQAYALGKLGGTVTMLGAVGKDAAGQVLLQSLNSVGVDTTRMKQTDSAHTGTAFITVNADGDNSIIVVQGANKEVDTAYIDANIDVLKNCDLVLMQLEIPLETVIYAAQKAKELGKTVVLDPAPARSDIPEELFACVDYIKPNEVELGVLVEDAKAEDHLRASANKLQSFGVKNVVVTLGGKGAYLCDENGSETCFSADDSVNVVDTTAAGDSFTAALAYGLSTGSGIRDAIDMAIAVSNVVVTKKGAQTSIPNMAEVEQYLERRKTKTAYS